MKNQEEKKMNTPKVEVGMVVYDGFKHEVLEVVAITNDDGGFKYHLMNLEEGHGLTCIHDSDFEESTARQRYMILERSRKRAERNTAERCHIVTPLPYFDRSYYAMAKVYRVTLGFGTRKPFDAILVNNGGGYELTFRKVIDDSIVRIFVSDVLKGDVQIEKYFPEKYVLGSIDLGVAYAEIEKKETNDETQSAPDASKEKSDDNEPGRCVAGLFVKTMPDSFKGKKKMTAKDAEAIFKAFEMLDKMNQAKKKEDENDEECDD